MRSIVGRFLEHSRVFYFRNGGAEDVYLASADWMDRNFFRRIELCFPVLDPALKRRVIREGLQPYLDDNCQAWEMRPDGSYEQLKPRARPAPLGAGRAALHARHPELTAGSGAGKPLQVEASPPSTLHRVARRPARPRRGVAPRDSFPHGGGGLRGAFPIRVFSSGKRAVERALLVGSLLLVLIVELLNSALEATLDRVSLEDHPLIGRAKDIASAAVGLSILNAGAIWLFILLG